ncbi:MAG: 2-iminobutanoate/2-iminopropanoate deaminase [Halieaceae bacterium]|jgi:2-iminobutanoate/2-iminopropanoate deaminase
MSISTAIPTVFNRGLLSALLVLGGLSVGASADEAVYLAPPGSDGSAPYSPAVIYGGVIYLSGQLGVVPDTGKLAEGGIGPETRQTMENVKATLERAGGSMDDVIKCTVFLADIAEWSAMNAVYTEFFSNMPARSAVGVSGLGLNARTEIECMAAAPDED